MVKKQIEEDLKKTISKLGYESSDIVLSIPENIDFGDYTTNVALQLSKQNLANGEQSSVDIASKILEKFGHPHYLERIEVAGPGFLNFFIKDELLIKNLGESIKVEGGGNFKDKKFLIEYGHVNILKEVHIGHLRTFTIGESMSRILEHLGAKVFRANYQGDVGLHVAKAIWGIKKIGIPQKNLNLEKKAKFLGQAYAKGNKYYEQDPKVKLEIDKINKLLYENQDLELKQLYDLAKKWSVEYFEPIYKLLGIKYDRCFFESEVAEEGKHLVREHVGKVFKEDQGAIIFPGENYNLHTRVFVTSVGHPTYEGKEIGLAKLEFDTFRYDQSIHIVASEQAGYFEVVIKAIELIFPNLKGKKHHLSYGLVDLKEGKMSSRTGQVVTIDQLVELISKQLKANINSSKLAQDSKLINKIALGAIKFSYLKFSPKTNMVFDVDQSISLSGDSGPYLQYTFARTQSILKNASFLGHVTQNQLKKYDSLNQEERKVLRQLEYFDLIIEQSATNYQPNLICGYLIELAKAFNLFYQMHPVIKSKQADLRLVLTKAVGEKIKLGLNLLGIEAPERM
ncbi:arginine--tRNA ligase [Candidatus Daviesbacteria bacterium]|nr:arginine--tRNA ligase [Candidatus Daviesbacteria bacterium]